MERTRWRSRDSLNRYSAARLKRRLLTGASQIACALLAVTAAASCAVGPVDFSGNSETVAYRMDLDKRVAAIRAADAAAAAACQKPDAGCRQPLNALEVQSRALNEFLTKEPPSCLARARELYGHAAADYFRGTDEALVDYDVSLPGWAIGWTEIAQGRDELSQAAQAEAHTVCTS